jgi:tetratricopeptide (TPR) repeat protein
MAGVAKTTSEQLIEEINGLKVEHHRSEFRIRGLRKKAEDLVKIDAANGYSALGMLASLDNDAAAAASYFEKALKLKPNEFTSLYNYMVSLRSQSLLAEFAARTDKLLSVAGTPLEKQIATVSKVLSLVEVGKFDEAYEFYLQQEPLINHGSLDDHTNEVVSMINNIPNFCNFLEIHDVEKGLFPECLSIMDRLIHDKNINFWDTVLSACNEADEPCFVIEKRVVCGQEEASELSELLSDALAKTEKFDKFTDRVICKFSARM